MDWFNLVIMLVLGGLAGVGFSYLLFEKRSSQHQQSVDEKIRQQREELEKSHQIRIQETVQSLQQEHQNQVQHYETQLEQMRANLQEREAEVQQLSQSLTASEVQSQQLTEQLQQREDRVEEMNQSLIQYQTILQQVTEELEATQAQVQQLSQSWLEAENQPSIPLEETSIIEPTASVSELDLELPVAETETPTLTELSTEPAGELIIPEPSALAEVTPEPPGELVSLDTPTVEEVAETPTASEIITEPNTGELIIPETPTASEIITEPVISSGEIVEGGTISAPSLLGTPETSISLTPSTGEQRLIEQILSVGKTGNLAGVHSLIGYIHHPNPQVRHAIVSSLGQLTSSYRLSREVQQMIPILTRMSRDRDATVRQQAVITLGNIKSPQVIPVLQQALHDSNSAVTQAASLALNKFKFYRLGGKPQPKSLMKTKINPKN